jgi:hypothetical protein
MCAVRERLQQRVAVVEQMDVSLGDIEVAVLAGNGHGDHVAQGAGHLDARRAPTDNDEVERATPYERRIPIDLLE